MLEVTRDTDVYTAHDEHVGSVDRIVIDPVTSLMSHVVVRKGIFFPEDKLIPIEDIATATPERINLRRYVTVDGLLPFVEQHYIPLDEAVDADGNLSEDTSFVAAWNGPLGLAAPMHEIAFQTVSERNIPGRMTALDAGVPVFASDRVVVGHLERLVTTDAGQPTHIVIEADGLSPALRAVPIGWVEDISEDAIMLGATARMIDSLPPE